MAELDEYEASKLVCPKIGLLFVFEAVDDDAPAAAAVAAPPPKTNGADEEVEEGFAAVDRLVEVIEGVGNDNDVVAVGAENIDEAGFMPKIEDDEAVVVVAAAAPVVDAPNNEVVAGLPNTKPVVELLTVVVADGVAVEAAANAPKMGEVTLFDASPLFAFDAAGVVVCDEPNCESPPLGPLVDD